MTKDKQIVAMTHKTCPICGKNTEEGILISKRLQDISAMHNKSTGFSKPCEECQSGIDQGAIMIIVVDQAKSGEKFEDLYRTGNIFGVKEEAVRRMLESSSLLEGVLKSRVAIMDYKDAIEFGLPVKYTP